MRLHLDDFERALLFKHLELVGVPGVASRLAEECMQLSLAINQYMAGRSDLRGVMEAMAGVQVRIAAFTNVSGEESLQRWLGLTLVEIQEDIERHGGKQTKQGETHDDQR
jgi:hypothetical protein